MPVLPLSLAFHDLQQLFRVTHFQRQRLGSELLQDVRGLTEIYRLVGDRDTVGDVLCRTPEPAGSILQLVVGLVEYPLGLVLYRLFRWQFTLQGRLDGCIVQSGQIHAQLVQIVA